MGGAACLWEPPGQAVAPSSPLGRSKVAHRNAPCTRSFPVVTSGVDGPHRAGVPPTVVGVTETWRVEPSGPLRGDIGVRGSKNAVTKHMVAAMLGDGPSTIRNAPEVGDVDITAAMLEAVGFQVSRSGGEITIAPNGKLESRVPAAFTGLNRIPILMLGPVLHNAATEPEVVELALFLQRMGAHIELSPDRRIVIEGVPRLRGASRWLAGDRLEAFSYLVAGLITRGEVRVHGCPQDRLVTAITTLAKMGAQIDITDEWITASAPSGLRPAAVHTDTHPGFMTDWQQPLMVLFTQAEGMSVLHETVFENRLVYVPALKEMGCEIETFAACLAGEACRFHDTNSVHSAVIRGVSKLRGADVTLPDVRAGFSAVLAAAVADRPSVLRGIHHIERGYHRPFEQFGSLGLTIRRG